MKSADRDNDKDLRPQPTGIFSHSMIICQLEANKAVSYHSIIELAQDLTCSTDDSHQRKVEGSFQLTE